MQTPASQSIASIQLVPGISRANALVFFYAAFIGITLNTYVNFIQPYVLTEQLLIPEAEQGRVTGDLVFFSELALLAFCAWAGLLADRHGRRFVFTLGFIVLAVGFSLYGFVDTYAQLLLLRLGIALGVACINVMVSTVQADYPQEGSRGRFVGITGFCVGIGALFLVFVLSKLPLWFSTLSDPATAGRYALITTAMIAVLSALVMRFGLSDNNPSDNHDQINTPNWRQRLTQSLAAAKVNPKVGLAYGCAFVARGDLIVIGVFFSLWMTQAGIASGMSTAAAVKTGGMYFGIVQGAALVSAPILGFLNDRLERIKALQISLLLAALGYGSLGFITDPMEGLMLPVAILLGIGQMSVMLASQTLIGQEAPIQMRGAVMGMFSICGALGILFITKVGGIAFDAWKPAPFVIVAICNIILCLAAWLVTRKAKQATAVVQH